MAGFRVDADIVGRAGSRVRSDSAALDPGLPAGPGGCGSRQVTDTWDAVCERLVWAVDGRLLPMVALWGARVEGAAAWVRERDRAVGQLLSSETATARLPEFRVDRSAASGRGRRFTGSGGPGMLWDESDPGRGDDHGLEATTVWLDTVLTQVLGLRSSVTGQLAVLRDAWRGDVGAQLVAAGERVVALLTRVAEILNQAPAPVCGYAGQLRDIAARSRALTQRLDSADQELGRGLDALRIARANPAGADPVTVTTLSRRVDEAKRSSRLALGQLAALAEERAMADRAVVHTGESVIQAVSLAVPADDAAFDTASGLSIVGASIRQAPRNQPAAVASDAEIDAIEAVLDYDGDGILTPLNALLSGLADGSLTAGGLVTALLGLSAADRRRFNELLDAYRLTDPDLVVRFSSALLAGAAADQVRRLVQQFPWVEPRLLDGDELSMRDPVQFDLDDVRWQGISQGSANDCWLLAGIGATAAADIEAVRRNITVNANGTYTVRIYKNGRPVDVTVSGYVPMNGDRPLYAGQITDGKREQSWLSIYEKAAAQVLGGGSYGGLTAGRPSTGISAVTGQPTDFLSTNPLSLPGSQTFERIQEAVDAGQPVAALTMWRFSDHTIAGWHVYYVTGIEGDRIVVQNPWGYAGDTEAETLYLTEAQFDKKFAWASAGRG